MDLEEENVKKLSFSDFGGGDKIGFEDFGPQNIVYVDRKKMGRDASVRY